MAPDEVPVVQQLGFAHSAGRSSAVDLVLLSELRARPLDHSIFDPRRLRFHALHFVLSGSGRHWTDFDAVDLQAGDVLHIRPGQVQSFDAKSGHDALLLFFTPAVLQEIVGVDARAWHFDKVLRPTPEDFEVLVSLLRLQAKLDAIAVELDPVRVGPSVLNSVLSGIASIVSRRLVDVEPGALRQADLLERFDELLDIHHGERRTAEWYAERLGASTRTLARACQARSGCSPKERIDRRVVLEARRLLAVTGATVDEIATELGFTEPTNFVKFFRRIMGITPDAFRRKA